MKFQITFHVGPLAYIDLIVIKQLPIGIKEFINGGISYTAIIPSVVEDLGQFTQVAVVTSPVSHPELTHSRIPTKISAAKCYLH